MKKFFCLKLAFQANCIQVHFTYYLELILQSVLVRAQQHILAPARTANQNRLSRYAKEPGAICSQLRSNLSKSKIYAPLVGLYAANGHAHRKLFQVWSSHLRWPPQRRIVNLQLIEFIRRK